MTESVAADYNVSGIGPIPQKSAEIPKEKSLRVLYMDDDPAMARLLQKHLTRAGCKVDVAHDGKAGLSLHRSDPFDFLIIDYRMPGMTGIDVLRALSAEGNMPPSVILTVAGDEMTAVEAMKLGASDYILKDPDGGYLELMPLVIHRALQQKQIAEERKAAEKRLRSSHDELEKLVKARTAELVIANDALREEIAERKRAEERLKDTHRKLEILVKERTRDLEKKTIRLEELNIALKVLLKKREEDQRELEENILYNVKKFISPCIDKLKKNTLNCNQSACLSQLESHINEIVSPFAKTLAAKYADFTPAEIRIAEMIRQDKATKEIADFLNISVSAIIFHRNNIRKKIGLVNKKISLKSYLQTLS